MGMAGVCGPKAKIPQSRDEAKRALQRLVAMGDDSAQLNIYKCSACKRWHVGHNKHPRPSRAIVSRPDA